MLHKELFANSGAGMALIHLGYKLFQHDELDKVSPDRFHQVMRDCYPSLDQIQSVLQVLNNLKRLRTLSIATILTISAHCRVLPGEISGTTKLLSSGMVKVAGRSPRIVWGHPWRFSGVAKPPPSECPQVGWLLMLPPSPNSSLALPCHTGDWSDWTHDKPQET